MNGFSFCTPSKTDFIPFSDGIDTFKEVLKELIDFYPKQTFAATPGCLLSSALYICSCGLYLMQICSQIICNYTEPLKNLTDLIYEEIEALDQVQVYAYPKEIHLILKKVLSPVYCMSLQQYSFD